MSVKAINYQNLTKEQRLRLAKARTAQYRMQGPNAKLPFKIMNPISKGSTNQQAIRTGGWANPSKGGELKFCDTGLSTAITFGSSAWSTPQLVNAIAQGTDASNRIGRKIILKSLLIRYAIKLGSTSTFGSQVRILVVYDKQANATAPAITDILTLDEYFAPNNLSNRDRFVTIFDHTTEAISAGSNAQVGDTLYKRINLETIYNSGTDAAIGSIASGSVYLMFAQAGGLLTANGNINGRIRLRYTDV